MTPASLAAPDVATALFCERVTDLPDGRKQPTGVIPGLLRVSGPPGGTVRLDLFLLLRAPAPGPGTVDLMVTGPGGRQVVYASLDYACDDPRVHVQIAVANIALPAAGSGPVTAQVRSPGGTWVEAARLDVECLPPPPFVMTARFGYGPGAAP